MPIIVPQSLKIAQNLPLDSRGEVSSISNYKSIEYPFIGMVFSATAENKTYKVTGLAPGYLVYSTNTLQPTVPPGTVNVDYEIISDVYIDTYELYAELETPESIKTKYESNAGVESFTDIEKTKLASIEEGAQANPSFKTVGGESIIGTGDIAVLSTFDIQSETFANYTALTSYASSTPLGIGDEGKAYKVNAYSTYPELTYVWTGSSFQPEGEGFNLSVANVTDVVEVGNTNPVSSGGVYDYLQNLTNCSIEYSTPTEIGTLSSSTFEGAYNLSFFTTRTDLWANVNRVIDVIHFILNGSANITFSVCFLDTGGVLTVVEDFTVAGVNGLNSIPVNINLPANHLIAVKYPLLAGLGLTTGGAGRINYDGAGVQYLSETIYTPCYWMTTKEIIINEPVLATTEYVKELIDGEFSAETIVGQLVSDSTYVIDSADRIILREDLISSNKTILTKIYIEATATGVVTFAIGLVDQNNKFITKSTFEKNVVSGVNELAVNISLGSYEAIAIKAPTTVGIRYLSSAGNGHTATFTNYGLRVPDTNKEFAIWVERRDVILSPTIANYVEFKEVKNDVEILKSAPNPKVYTDEITGIKYKTVVKNGVLGVEEIGIGKVLILGNSLAKHPILPYWWGEYGMAASEREKDYAHIIYNAIKANHPAATLQVENIAEWEVDHANYSLTNFDPFFTIVPDVVFLRLGENVSNTTGYQASYSNLVSYILAKAPNAQIILGGMFWTDPNRDAAMSAVAAANALPFVTFSEFDTPANKSFIGAQVYGDDNQWHSVNNGGVANHPGDIGMANIANKTLLQIVY